MICGRKGYDLKVVMPENVTPERTELLRMYGAEIVYSEGSKGSNGAVEMALDMAEKDASYYMPYQYGNQANPDAHYNGTALEILEELDEVAAFVAGLGTGGTLMGNGRRLKEELGDDVKIVAAEPMQGEPVQGLRSLEDGFIPPIIDLSLLDRKIFVTNHDAIVWTRKLLDEERLFAGVSSGAIARVAVRIAGELDEGNVVFIVCDDGWKYLPQASTRGRWTRSRTWTPPSGGSRGREASGRPLPGGADRAPGAPTLGHAALTLAGCGSKPKVPTKAVERPAAGAAQADLALLNSLLDLERQHGGRLHGRDPLLPRPKPGRPGSSCPRSSCTPGSCFADQGGRRDSALAGRATTSVIRVPPGTC